MEQLLKPAIKNAVGISGNAGNGNARTVVNGEAGNGIANAKQGVFPARRFHSAVKIFPDFFNFKMFIVCLCLMALPNLTKAQTTTWSIITSYDSNTTLNNVNITQSGAAVTVAAGVTVTVNGVVSGGDKSDYLHKRGAGTLIFNGANIYID